MHARRVVSMLIQDVLNVYLFVRKHHNRNFSNIDPPEFSDHTKEMAAQQKTTIKITDEKRNNTNDININNYIAFYKEITRLRGEAG
jgi:hypothetical protein